MGQPGARLLAMLPDSAYAMPIAELLYSSEIDWARPPKGLLGMGRDDKRAQCIEIEVTHFRRPCESDRPGNLRFVSA
jgi:hypothetical protein